MTGKYVLSKRITNHRIGIALVAFLCLTACSDPLRQMADALNTTQKTIGVLQSTVIDANAQGLISADDVYAIKAVCDKVNSAGLEATRVTRNFSQLSATYKTALKPVMDLVVKAVDDSIASGLVGITNPDLQTKVRGYLDSIKSALAVVEAVIGV